MRRTLRLASLLLCLASSAWATTYYVHPDGTCSDDNDGNVSTSPWCTPPGTRNTGNTGFLSGGSWGSIDGTPQIACGDTILLYPGDTHDSADGGAWCIANTGDSGGSSICNDGTRYYSNCTLANPITIKLANSSTWSGAPDSGNFTISGTGITGTQVAGYDVDAMLAIGIIDGLKILGLSDSRRIIVESPGNNLSGSNHHIPILIGETSGTNNANDGMVLEYVTSQDSRDWGIGLNGVTNYRFSHITITGANAHCIAQGVSVDKPTGTGVWEDLIATDCGAGSVPFSSDGIYVQGSVRAWFVRPYIHDMVTNCISGGSYLSSGGTTDQPATFRAIWRDAELIKCGTERVSGGNVVGAGVAWDGDGDIKSYHSYVFLQHPVVYGNKGPAIWQNHGTGRMLVFNATLFGNGWEDTQTSAELTHERTGDAGAFVNMIVKPRSYAKGQAWEHNASSTVFDVKPFVAFSLFDYMSASSETITSFSYGSAWPTASGTFSATSRAYTAASSANIWGDGNLISAGTRYTPDFTSTGGNCDVQGGTYADCDFTLQATSDAIDAGTYFLRVDDPDGGSGDTITVKPSDATSALCRYNSDAGWGNCGTVGNTDTDLDAEYGDPRNFFIEPATCPDCAGDIIQIKGGDCTGGAAAYGNAERAKIVSMTATTITLDRNCTWADDAGVHRIWYGAAPDMGALESGGDCHGAR